MGIYPRHKIRTARRAVFWTLLVFLPVAECTLRVLGVSNPEFFHNDALLGGAHIPGSEGWSGKEGGAFVRINTSGMRDVERHPDKPPGTFRVAVLGDSYTEALQVPLEKTFCTWVERQLAANPAFAGKQVEVLNFGCSGYGTTQEYLLLRERVWKFEPDLILLAFSPCTNIRNNSRALMGSNPRPYFVRDEGRLVLDMSFKESKGYTVAGNSRCALLPGALNHCRLLQVLNTVRHNVRAQWSGEQGRESAGGGGGEAGLDYAVYKEPPDAQWAEAWHITEEVLTMIRDEAAAHHARFVVVTLSSGFQVNPDATERERVREQLGIDDPFYPEKRLGAFLRREGIPMLPLAPTLQRLAEDRHVYLHGFRASGTLGTGHWNEDGHRLAGELIADWLRVECGPSEGCPARELSWQRQDPK
jgi:hypothetical protein